ncbi:F-box/kelch-repeat protein At3g23880-like [Solanum stenotomum]|uniref:F-box/kelch-repeat protein At3g23880-like n=1 Tax=Solanum stenotomum TaxID=172797 RepID=UPI0020D04A80|nr:F-box/kelch-repeat protein At3g23880-like [Solanum stenotomum]XP_049406440.1 F-box/kelch-repeat protein At3g23880-like [Solanum stenotomum]
MLESILGIPTLPSELITEILSRLPVKSLLKFTSVSKSWLDLISSPEFIKSQLNLSANNKDNTHHRLMWCDYDDDNLKDWSLRPVLYESNATEASYFNFPMKKQQQIRYINHVNGLFFVDWSNNLFLWNPSIRKYKKVPHCTTNSRDAICVIYGFGYDKFCDDYKVVACTYYNGQYSYDTQVHIYSLKTDSRRNIHCLDQKRDFIENSGKFVNGKIYWVNDDSSDPNIFYIDLVNEKLEKMEQPPHGEGNYDLQLGLL